MDDPKGLEKFRTRTELDVQFADALRVIAEQRSAIEAATKRAEVAEAKLAEVRKVVTERIAACQRAEAKFAPGWTADVSPKHHRGPPQALVEAWAERQAMAAVLAILNDTETTP